MSHETRPGAGLVKLSATPVKGIRAVIVQTGGNMGVLMADGSSNDADVVVVTAGMWFPLQAMATTANNTAVLLGVR